MAFETDVEKSAAAMPAAVVTAKQDGSKREQASTVKVEPSQTLNSGRADSTSSTLKEEQPVLADYDPKRRTKLYRWTVVVLLACFYNIANIAVGIIAPVAPNLLAEFGPLSNPSFYQTLLVAIWGFGQAAGPLCIGPLTEKFGRLPVQHGSTLLFIIFSIVGAYSKNISMVVGFRFLMALTNISGALNGPIIGDLFTGNDRAHAMAVNQLVGMLGTGIGPVAGSYVTKLNGGWRWSFWLMAIIAAGVELPLLLVYRESYLPKLMRRYERDVERVRASGEARVSESSTVRSEEDAKQPVRPSLLETVIRPFKILVLSPALMVVTLHVSYLYGVGYTFLATIVQVFMDSYDFSTEAASFSYFGPTIGLVIGSIYCMICTKPFVQFCRQRFSPSEGQVKPEFLLSPLVPVGILMPIGVALYGWSAERTLPWILCFVGIALAMSSVSVAMVVANNYVVSAFGDYAASASAISVSMRFLTGAVLPLASPALYGNLGLGWGNTLFALISVLFVPLPYFMLRRGEWLRSLGPYGYLAKGGR